MNTESLWYSMAVFHPALLGCLARLGCTPAKLLIARESSLAAWRSRQRPRPFDALAGLLGARSIGRAVLPSYRPPGGNVADHTSGRLQILPAAAPPSPTWRRRVTHARDVTSPPDAQGTSRQCNP